MIRNSFFIGLMGLLALSACHSTSRMSSRNLAGFYDLANPSFRMIESVAYNRDQDHCRLYIRISPEALAAMQPDDPRDPVFLSYVVTPSFLSSDITDSGTIAVDVFTQDQTLILEQDVRAPAGEDYVISIMSSNQKLAHIQEVERSFLYSHQDFLLLDKDGMPLFSNIVPEGRSFRLLLDAALIDQLQVRYYRRDYPVALPPFSFEKDFAFDYSADSVYFVSLTEGMTDVLKIPGPGFCHFVADTNKRHGKTVFQFNEGFPFVSNASQMVDPLRYLTTDREFESMASSQDLKLEVDRFWLSITGNAERARTRIKTYYNRVEYANRLFSSYHEGWKTDRGLIYIIYGPPNIVYRTDDREKWVYGEEQSSRSIKFVFSRVANPFTRQDFSLNKSPVYKESWFNAVEVWRR